MVLNSLVFKLKKQIQIEVKGKVYVMCNGTDIYVDIENSPKDLWCTTIPVLRAKISDQKMVSILAKIVMAQYKEDILNKYFIK